MTKGAVWQRGGVPPGCGNAVAISILDATLGVPMGFGDVATALVNMDIHN
jgi:hypothetical protein